MVPYVIQPTPGITALILQENGAILSFLQHAELAHCWKTPEQEKDPGIMWPNYVYGLTVIGLTK